jgi:site-specific DNA-cytosine methylase
MFSGIGGFELGIQNAYGSKERGSQEDPPAVTEAGPRLFTTQGKDFSTEIGRIGERTTDGANERPLCIGYSEIDKYAIKVYERHFREHKNYGDATKITTTDLPDFDLLVGGFPCQAFSIAGKRLGFDDTRGTLFFDIARILKEKRPGHLVLENVKGLLSHDGCKTFQAILGVLADLGYRVEWQVLNSKDFGVPQNRERVYIVGHLGDGCGRQVLPLRQSSKTPDEHSRQEPGLFSGAVDSNYYKGHDGKRTLVAEPRIRRLTPKECERLQGFPDDWTAYGRVMIPMPAHEDPHGAYARPSIEIISDTQRYKMCGNAVTVNVARAVMERLYAHETS